MQGQGQSFTVANAGIPFHSSANHVYSYYPAGSQSSFSNGDTATQNASQNAQATSSAAYSYSYAPNSHIPAPYGGQPAQTSPSPSMISSLPPAAPPVAAGNSQDVVRELQTARVELEKQKLETTSLRDLVSSLQGALAAEKQRGEDLSRQLHTEAVAHATLKVRRLEAGGGEEGAAGVCGRPGGGGRSDSKGGTHPHSWWPGATRVQASRRHRPRHRLAPCCT